MCAYWKSHILILQEVTSLIRELVVDIAVTESLPMFENQLAYCRQEVMLKLVLDLGKKSPPCGSITIHNLTAGATTRQD